MSSGDAMILLTLHRTLWVSLHLHIKQQKRLTAQIIKIIRCKNKFSLFFFIQDKHLFINENEEACHSKYLSLAFKPSLNFWWQINFISIEAFGWAGHLTIESFVFFENGGLPFSHKKNRLQKWQFFMFSGFFSVFFFWNRFKLSNNY